MNSQSKYPYPDFPIAFFSFQNTGANCLPPRSHRHEDLELILAGGHGLKVQIEDHILELGAGQGLFINRYIPHAISYGMDQACKFSILRFLPGLLFDSAGGLLTEKYRDKVLDSPRLRFLLLDRYNRETREMLATTGQLALTMEARQEGYELEVRALACCLWKHLVSLAGQTTGQPLMGRQTQMDGQRIKTAVQFIEGHFAEPLTLEDIAASIHTSDSECCRCFRRVLDTTPIEYLLKYRIYEAASRLAQKEAAAETISQLAASVGFNSPSYFNKKFKQYLHCTPREYLSRLRQAHS